MINRAVLLDLLKAARKWQAAAFPTQKASTIDALIRGYVDDITRDFQDVLDGDLLDSEAKRRHRGYIERDAPAVYDAGLIDIGVDPADKDAIDEAAISDWAMEQAGHVDSLWADIQKLIDDYSNGQTTHAIFNDRRRAMYERLGQWGESLRNLYSLAKANAKKNMSVTWHFGDTDHCDTCAKLDGQRHRLRWFLDKGYIPQENGSQTLDCRGFHCQCTLVDDNGDQVMP